MAKCPKCNTEINHLNCEYHTIAFGKMYPDGRERDDYPPSDDLEEEAWYFCPKCGEELFDNEDDALEFLKEKYNNYIVSRRILRW